MKGSITEFDTGRSILQRIDFSPVQGITFYIKRDDLIHPVVSGNKWRKLKYHIQAFRENPDLHRIVTFGGAYSNHLIATACAGAVMGIPVSGIVRGDELSEDSNPVLRMCGLYGMDLHFVDRNNYRKKDSLVQEMFGDDVYVVPEGGGGMQGTMGCMEILDDLGDRVDHIFTGVGTGTTLAGMAREAMGTNVVVEGVAVLKDADYLRNEIIRRYNTDNFILHTDFHGGGFAKLPDEILDLGRQFVRETGILLDPVYTVKVLYAIIILNNRGYFKPGSRVCMLHTGGLTGWLG